MPSGSLARPKNGTSVRVKLEKRPKTGLGICIKSENGKTIVSSLLKGGVAEESGLVQAGDIICRVNDIEITRLPYSSVLEILEAIPFGVPVILLLSCPVSQSTCLQTTFTNDGMPYTVRISQNITSPNRKHCGGTSLDDNRNKSGNQLQQNGIPQQNGDVKQNGGTHILSSSKKYAFGNQKTLLQSKPYDNKQIKGNIPVENGNAGVKSSAQTAENTLPNNKSAEPQDAVQQCSVSTKKYQPLQFLLEEGKTFNDTLHKKAVAVRYISFYFTLLYFKRYGWA